MAMVMVIIGFLAGAGISVFRVVYERQIRSNTIEYMKSVKKSTIAYAVMNGFLPGADTDGDWIGDDETRPGFLPHADLTVPSTDSHSRRLRYQINAALGVATATRATTCKALRNVITGNPQVVEDDGTGTDTPNPPISVAAIIVSAGPIDADSSAELNTGAFDDVTGWGSNVTGTPFVRHTPIETTNGFDDLVMYVTTAELYIGMECSLIDECPQGIEVVNNYSADLYVSSDCATWANTTSRWLTRYDTYSIYIDNPCVTPMATANIYYRDLVTTTDADGDCEVQIDTFGALVED